MFCHNKELMFVVCPCVNDIWLVSWILLFVLLACKFFDFCVVIFLKFIFKVKKETVYMCVCMRTHACTYALLCACVPVCVRVFVCEHRCPWPSGEGIGFLQLE